MTIFRFILQEYGFISAEDTHLKDLLRDSDDTVWKHAAYLLETAKLMPGGCFTLELTSTPPLEAINALVEENKTDRNGSFGGGLNQGKALFDCIVSQAFGAVIPGRSVHRFSSMNGCALRGAGLMQSFQGREFIAARIAVRNASGNESTAIVKWSKTDSAKGNASLNYERTVLNHLRQVRDVVRLFEGGALESKTIRRNCLLTDDAYGHHSDYESMSVRGLIHLAQRAAALLNELHSLGFCQNNTSTRSLRFNPMDDSVKLISMQYVSLDPSASDDAKRRALEEGIGAPPRAAPSRNLAWFDEQPSSALKDSFLLGCTMLSCIARDSGFFLTRGAIDLSKLGDGSEQTVVRIIGEAVSRFNKHIAEGDPHLQMEIGLVMVVQGLLRKSPAERISCLSARQMLDTQSVPPQLRVQVLQVPAKYCPLIGEMQRPYEIYTTRCINQEGNEIDGYGIRALGNGLPGDLISLYMGNVVDDKFHADLLNAFSLGNTIKSLGKLSLVGGWNENTIRSLLWLAENGAGSLANCNNRVSFVNNGRGGKCTVFEPIPATAFWDLVVFPQERQLPIPGNVWSRAVFALRVAKNVSHGEEYVVSYGTATTRAMFVLPGQEFVVRKRTKLNQAKV